MRIKQPLKTVLIYLLELTLISTFFGLYGCSSAPTRGKAVERNCFEDNAKLQDGMDAFYREDYNGAAAIFEALSRRTKNKVVLRRALYGLACTKLAEARNESDVKEAILVWNRWKRLNSTRLEPEDPLMLSPFFDKMMAPDNLLSTSCTPDDTELKSIESCESLLNKKKKEIQSMKSKLEARQEDIESLHKKIQKLKLQIESLEAIHLEIQEKKKEVTSQ